MEIVCSHCGKALPGEGARFCSHCGTPVASLASSSSAPPVKRTQSKKPALREQIAQQPPPRPQQIVKPLEADLSSESTIVVTPELARELPVKVWEQQAIPSSEKVEKQSDQQRTSVKDISEQETTEQKNVQKPEQEKTGEELSTQPVMTLPVEPSEGQSSEEERTVEELPTRPLTVSSSPEHPSVVEASSAIPSSLPAEDSQRHEEIALLDTQLLHEHGSVNPLEIVRENIVAPAAQKDQPQRLPIMRKAAVTGQVNTSTATFPHMKRRKRAPLTSVPDLLARGKSHRLPVIVVTILVLLVVISSGIWIVVYQPFSVAPVTAPWQGYRDVGLGLAIEYPNGWLKDSGKSVVRFYDSSHTDEVDITVASAGPGDLVGYLRQQAGKLGMTGTKATGAVTFAGSVWQQVQGGVQQSGANYSGAMFATVHGGRLYTLTQLAPQSTYNDEERLTFSVMRGSLQFT